MEALQAYTCTATPCLERGSPPPQTVRKPSRKSVSVVGMLKGFHLNWFGFGLRSPNFDTVFDSILTKGLCFTDGLIL